MVSSKRFGRLQPKEKIRCDSVFFFGGAVDRKNVQKETKIQFSLVH